ncbi:hypothetical protein [Indioceanicola profundi]|uniref:hypothetical protein n=1 Tax=Indioceanicola profundi TaxID=2220096 RepID=UPI000E6AB940|nr:hypothetical protein [Indioceanicola profundi]
MLKWIRNRLVGYEVFFQHEGRWRLEAVTDDEDAAVALARKALGSGGTLSARVVRQRSMLNGFTTETVIFEDAVQAREKPVVVASPSQPTPLCATVADLCEDAGRQVVGQVLKDYLARNNLTATELLHGWSHARRLQDKGGGIVTAAIHRTATAQAATTGTSVKDRVKELIGLVDQATGLARDFAAERKRLPPFQGADIAAYARTVQAAVGEDRYAYAMRSLLTVWLFEISSLPGKLDSVVELMEQPDIDEPLMRLLDGIAADTLIFADVIQDVFGARSNLAGFLCALAGFLQGRQVGGMSPGAARLSGLIGRGVAPLCRQVLTARLVQEIASDKPLDKLNPAADGTLIEELTTALMQGNGEMFGGEAVRKAMSIRRLRNRQDVLRAKGLHAVADNLRAE